jgi:hypothetical protein
MDEKWDFTIPIRQFLPMFGVLHQNCSNFFWIDVASCEVSDIDGRTQIKQFFFVRQLEFSQLNEWAASSRAHGCRVSWRKTRQRLSLSTTREEA